MKNIVILAPNKRSFINNRLSLALELASQYKVYVVLPCDEDILENYNNIYFIQAEYDRKSLSLIKFICAIKNVRNALRNVPKEFVFSYGIYANALNVILALFRRHGKVITLFTGLGYFFSYTNLRGVINRILFMPIIVLIARLSHKVLVQNSEDYLLLKSFTKGSKLLKTDGSGLNTNYWNCSSPNPGSKALRVIHVSRMLREKGLIEYARLSSRFSESTPIDFIHCGPYDKDLKGSISLEEIAREVPNHRINFLGNVTDMRQLYCESDILFFPSWREGFSRAVCEAMSCGVVPVVWNVPGCSDAVDNGVNGIILDFNDLNSAEKLLNFWAVDRTCLSIISENSVVRAKLFDSMIINNSIVKFIHG